MDNAWTLSTDKRQTPDTLRRPVDRQLACKTDDNDDDDDELMMIVQQKLTAASAAVPLPVAYQY